MGKKELSLEEQRLKVRRKLLKMAVYGIPAISTILAAGKANADDAVDTYGDAVDAYYDEFDEDTEEDRENRAGTGEKVHRRKPGGHKKYKTGLS